MRNKKKITSVLILLFVILAAGTVSYFLYFKQLSITPTSTKEPPTKPEIGHGPCLKENEFADYPINPKYAVEVKAPLNPLIISIRDKTTQKEKFSFQIEDINPDHYHPLELHKCSVYVIKRFNYDPKKSIQAPGYKVELWRYDYNANGESIFLFAEKDELGLYKAEFNDDFSIDPDEKYLALEKGHLGKEDYALVIKNLKTKKDLFELRLKEILARYPDITPGDMQLGGWIEGGKYYWSTLSQGAVDTAYYRIESGTWRTEIFPSPPDILAGVERATNIRRFYLAYVDIPTFTGIQEVYEQIIEKAKKEGKQKNLYVYNLKTKEKIKIASAEPEWRFNIKWISDSELEYELPSEEKKIYKIK